MGLQKSERKKTMRAKTIGIASAVALAVGVCGYALFAEPVMMATEAYVTNETAKVEEKLDKAKSELLTEIGTASNNVVVVASDKDYIVQTNLEAKINRLNDKPLGVKWEALMINGQLYYVATMPADEEESCE